MSGLSLRRCPSQTGGEEGHSALWFKLFCAVTPLLGAAALKRHYAQPAHARRIIFNTLNTPRLFGIVITDTYDADMHKTRCVNPFLRACTNAISAFKPYFKRAKELGCQFQGMLVSK